MLNLDVPKITKEQLMYFTEKLADNKQALEILISLIKAEAQHKEASKTSILKEFSASKAKLDEKLALLEGMTLLDVETRGMLYMIRLNKNGRDLVNSLVDAGIIKINENGEVSL